MPILRIKKRENPYAQIDKTAIYDARLSFKARGILCYLLSKPDNWKVDIDDLIRQSIDGRDSIYAGLKELRGTGYAELVNAFDDQGRLLGKEYIIHEVAISGKSRNGKKPKWGKAKLGKSVPINNNEEINSNNDNSVETEPQFPFSAFWEAYGFKKGSKSKAAEKYARLSAKDVEDIQRTLPLYLAETTTIDTGRDRANFRPMRRHAEFYLSGRMWEAYADKAAEIEAENAKHPEWDAEYRDYLAWLNNNFPNILQLNKHLSKSQYIQYKTEYYVTGKTKLGTTLERTYLVRAHETMSTSSDVQHKYPDVFSLHCENVKQFIKAHAV